MVTPSVSAVIGTVASEPSCVLWIPTVVVSSCGGDAGLARVVRLCIDVTDGGRALEGETGLVVLETGLVVLETGLVVLETGLVVLESRDEELS